MQPTHTVLIVEDDADLREYLETLFSDDGFKTVVVSEGEKAIGYISKKKPDAVVLDLSLPDMSGGAVCDQIKATFPSLPIIILTASDDTKTVIQTFARGADDFLNKPFNGEELIARVKARIKASNTQSN